MGAQWKVRKSYQQQGNKSYQQQGNLLVLLPGFNDPQGFLDPARNSRTATPPAGRRPALGRPPRRAS